MCIARRLRSSIVFHAALNSVGLGYIFLSLSLDADGELFPLGGISNSRTRCFWALFLTTFPAWFYRNILIPFGNCSNTLPNGIWKTLLP